MGRARVAAAAGVLTAGGIVAYGFTSTDPQAWAESMAKVHCVGATVERMRDPDSARFEDIEAEPPEPDADDDEDGWIVTGTVRARNGFGGMTSNGFMCAAGPGDDGAWVAVSLLDEDMDEDLDG